MYARQVSLSLALCLAACGTSVGGQGGDDDDDDDGGLDIDVADGTSGLHATTTVDGEEIVIDATVETQPDQAPDEPAYQEFLILTIKGADDPPYAEWKLGIVTDVLTGRYAGLAFGDQSITSSAQFTELASGKVGTVLSEVSSRAAVDLAADQVSDDARLYLASVADVGPYLQALPTIMGGFDAVCGDGVCSVDETDENCPEDCGCAAEEGTCGGVAPFGCYCSDDCAATGDCCVDACQTCGAGCPPCADDQVPCGDSCTNAINACNGTPECPNGEDEAHCNSGACGAGQLACDDGTCIEVYQFCDEVNDCAGGEDELCECAFCDPSG
jgi:hypothetical protein